MGCCGQSLCCPEQQRMYGWGNERVGRAPLHLVSFLRRQAPQPRGAGARAESAHGGPLAAVHQRSARHHRPHPAECRGGIRQSMI